MYKITGLNAAAKEYIDQIRGVEFITYLLAADAVERAREYTPERAFGIIRLEEKTK